MQPTRSMRAFQPTRVMMRPVPVSLVFLMPFHYDVTPSDQFMLHRTRSKPVRWSYDEDAHISKRFYWGPPPSTRERG